MSDFHVRENMTSHFKWFFRIILIPVLLVSGAVHAAVPTSVKVTEAEFGDKWPFTVSEGIIYSEPLQVETKVLQILTFKAEGKVYALNGLAISRIKTRGYYEIDEIWRTNPKIPGLKISISPIIERGLALSQK